ncbi:MAG: zinc ABC transporter substrate-binding protein [bacterium]|nr:zinc ABC transporter substrate-binding protein [bacterium]
MRRIVFSLLGIAALLGIGLLIGAQRRASSPLSTSGAPTSLSIVVSFYPLAEFARQVGGEQVAVTQITPTGVDAHDFQLSPQNIITIQSAKVFLYNGGGIEPWAERIHGEVERHDVRVVNKLRALGMEGEARAGRTEQTEHSGAKGPEDEHAPAAGGVNPHVWLDPVLVQRQIEIIRDVLAEVDPARAQSYRANADRYLANLRALDVAFREGLSTCKYREVIVAHDAFRHLAERYGLTILPLAGSSPEAEARPRQLADSVRRARSTGIRTVFSEVLVSPRITENFAREIGAEVRTLHPLEGLTEEELRQGKNYLSVMQENLRQLKRGLECA